MKALFIEPFNRPIVINIEAKLEEMCNLIHCDLIEHVYPFKDNVVLICDESGRISGQQYPNRKVNNEVIFGPIILLGIDTSDNYIELSEELIDKYYEKFYFPEFYYIDKDSNIHPLYKRYH